ncbi:DNA methyltransferase, partial [Escherichia coli]|nr:DNA methyltransferase [Escherichia coli]
HAPKWPQCGCIYGPQRKVAWRILDAQYFGVAQRRRRVFVVASARTDLDPATVLFEFEGVRRNIAPSRKKKEIASAIIANGAAISGESLNPCLHADMPPGMKSTKAVNAFRMAAFGEYIDDETASTVKARDFKDATDLAVFSSTGAGFWSEGHGTLRAREQESHEHLVTLAFPERMSGTQHAATKNTSPSLMAKNPTAVCYEVRNAEVAVRRLTPVECERLQGFPDGHTLIPTEKRKKVNSDELAYLRNHYPDLSEEEAAMLAADGPRYKAIGNSMAIPVMRWIGDRITKAVCRQKEGSETKERKVKPAAEFERSIFKWAGGKFGVLEQIFRYLPEGKRLIEPFVGGGAVFMNAGYQENLLNDVNADLINFYKTLQREAHSLITLAHRFFQDYNTQEGYLAVRNAFNKQVYDDLHRAAAFLFLNR